MTAGTYNWAFGDYACAENLFGNFVFECRYPNECQTKNPLEHANTYYWKLVENKSCTEQAGVPAKTDVACNNYWTNYNYLPDSIVYSVEGIFQCPGYSDIANAVNCAFTAPGLETGTVDGETKFVLISPWVQLKDNHNCISKTDHTDRPTTHTNTNTADWVTCHDFSQAQVSGDFIEYWGRVWECKKAATTDNLDCTFTTPGSD